jgi:hypothetical protein
VIPLYLGIDIGTSGCRAIAIDDDGGIHGRAFVSFPSPERSGPAIEQDPQIWWRGLQDLLKELSTHIPLHSIQGIAIDGTSGTVIAADHSGMPLFPALMYNDARALKQAQIISQIAPVNSAAHGAASGLAKSCWLLEQLKGKPVAYLLNQSDWMVGQLSGHYGLSDHNNCLKMGYDAMTHQWPEWLEKLHVLVDLLPKAYTPGSLLTHVSTKAEKITGLKTGTPILAGTTDSTAAIYATGANKVGDAITSLGSTLVTKVISETPIFLPSAGVYSQPFGQHWLVGGGSNSGGNVLLHFFTPEQMQVMSKKIDPELSPQLDYYPLLTPGERFPVNDPDLQPRLEPRPEDDVVFFQGLLEGIAAIEQQAYQLLAALGAPYPSRIFSAGGGASNPVWTQIRDKLLATQMVEAEQQDAAYGTAKLLLRNSPLQ